MLSRAVSVQHRVQQHSHEVTSTSFTFEAPACGSVPRLRASRRGREIVERLEVNVTSSKTDRGTMTREAPTLRSRSSCPALPRKISGEAFTTKASGIPQFP